MDTSFIIITPARWLLLSSIFLVLSFFMPRRIPWIISGTAALTAMVHFIYLLLNSAPPSVLFQMVTFCVVLVFALVFIRTVSLPSISTLKKGDTFILSSAIKNGKGVMKIDNKTYTLIGPDSPVKTFVTVVSIDENTVYISPVDQND